MSETSEAVPLGARETDLLISRLITKAVLVLIVLTFISIVQMVRLGTSDRYTLICVGSISSILALFAFPVTAAYVNSNSAPLKAPPLIWKVLGSIPFIGFIPYLFGCYLTFYEGVDSRFKV